MHTYKVEFTNEVGEGIWESIEAPGPGEAFAKCQKLHPGAIMLQAVRRQLRAGEVVGATVYNPPPVQRDPVKEPHPFRVPKPSEKDGTMPFYDSVVNPRP